MEQKSTADLRQDFKCQLHRVRVIIHEKTHHLTIVFEHACAGAYAVHEVFHFSAPVLWTAYGLLIFGVVSMITVIVTKGGTSL